MCGIAGCIDATGELGHRELQRMLAAMSHRGDSNFESAAVGSYFLGTNRLRIVDRERARQPLRSADGRFYCCLNGEIYNYKELRGQLLSRGASFYTDCDTEVALRAYEEWREAAFTKFNGMFAVAIADTVENRIVLARDRFGIKPLYLGRETSKWCFASELKAFTCEAKQIHCLSPGCFLALTEDGPGTTIAFPFEASNIPPTAMNLRAALEHAVRDHVQTDLPIAAFFSGGLDSAIVLMLARQFHANVVALTLGMPGSPDALFARRFCRDIGIENVEIPIDAEELKALTSEVILTCEGFHRNLIRGSQLTYLMCREAKARGFKIVICGEGSDELFCGYADFAFSGRATASLRQRFLEDLHRTQLQRVDRCGMRFSLEVRVPFLDNRVVDIALRAATSRLVGIRDGKVITKLLLREAAAELLPDFIAWRPKMTLMRGAGVVDASAPTWPLSEEMPEAPLENDEGPAWLNEEERRYYRVFRRHFPLPEQDAIEPVVTSVSENILCQ